MIWETRFPARRRCGSAQAARLRRVRSCRTKTAFIPCPACSREGKQIVRLDGLPGLWFSPALRSPADALNAPERKVHSLALAALTVLLMLAFVRSITERGDGRIWAGIFAGAALVQAFWGVPSTPEGSIRPLDMPGILAAAIALMLLPHVGRNIMRTRTCAPAVDILLLILALPGAALALLPILPGQAWTARLLSLCRSGPFSPCCPRWLCCCAAKKAACCSVLPALPWQSAACSGCGEWGIASRLRCGGRRLFSASVSPRCCWPQQRPAPPTRRTRRSPADFPKEKARLNYWK